MNYIVYKCKLVDHIHLHKPFFYFRVICTKYYHIFGHKVNFNSKIIRVLPVIIADHYLIKLDINQKKKKNS